MSEREKFTIYIYENCLVLCCFISASSSCRGFFVLLFDLLFVLLVGWFNIRLNIFFSCSSFICSWFGLVQCWLFSTDNFTCHICFMQTVHRHTPIARIHNRNLKILSVVCIVRECFCFVVRFYLLILNVFTRNCDMPTRESLQLDHRYC